MKILYLSYERSIELENFMLPDGKTIKHTVMYQDINEIEKKGLAEVIKECQEFAPDLIIEREFNDAKAIYTDLLKAFPTTVKVAWLIDTHVCWERHSEYAKNFDYVFLAVSKFVEPMRKHLGHNQVFWLPLCWPFRSDMITKNYNPIKYPIAFVGRFRSDVYPERALYVSGLAEHYSHAFTAVTDYNNMLNIVKRTKVCFNHSIVDDMNFRVFEVLGCGSELVTNDVEDLHKIRGLTSRLNIYQDFKSCVDKIDRIMADDPSTTKNGLDNQKWVKEKHCVIHRHLALLDMVKHGVQIEF